MERLLTIDRAVSHHRVKANPVPSPPSTLTFAYENLRYREYCLILAKLYKELSGDDNVLRTKILIELNEDFHFGDRVVQALKSSQIIEELMRGMKDPNEKIRQLSSHAVLLLGKCELGKVTLVEKGYILNISDLMDDAVPSIRSNSYNCLLEVAQYRLGIDSVIEFGIIQILVDKLILEKDNSILVLTLTLLNLLLEGEKGPRVALKTKIIVRLNGLLQSPNEKIKEISAQILGSLSFDEEGKFKTVGSGSIKVLCPLLKSQVSQVRCAVARCLASLAQLKEGKLQIFANNVMDEIMGLLNDEDEQTRLNIVQLIAAVAEYPPGRQKFKECRAKLKELIGAKEDYPLVSEFAKIALDVIDWIP